MYCIIDAFSTGKEIPSVFGNKCIHIQSSSKLPKKLSQPSDYQATFMYDGDFEKLLGLIRQYDIAFCIPGSESGVELADKLSEALKLPTNGTQLSEARRDKYKMIETVAAAGLKTVKHFKSEELEQIKDWVMKHDDFPVVLKPTKSANNNNVHICKNMQEVIDAFNQIIKSENVFGEKNNVVLVESFNPGQEFIVNTVSWEGLHFIVEIWKVNKVPGSIVYDNCEILRPIEQEYASIVDYTKKVLDAVGIKYGAGTTELKYHGSPTLIETAARLMSGANLLFSTKIFGFNQLTLLQEAYLQSESFLTRVKKGNSTDENNYGLAVLLLSNTTGVMQKDLKKEFSSLACVHSFDIACNIGSRLEITKDNDTCPGIIYLIGNNSVALKKDYECIRTLEKNGLYQRMVSLVVSNAMLIGELGLSKQWIGASVNNIDDAMSSYVPNNQTAVQINTRTLTANM